MSKARKGIWVSILVLFRVIPGIGQVVDDSTKQVYGPRTTHFLGLEDIKSNIYHYHDLDTGLYDLENFSMVDKSHRKYQDLGVDGTALHPIFPASPSVVGVRSGYSGYNPYFKKAHDFKFFDTKSPFMDVKLVLGGEGRSVVDFAFARNIKQNWNFGFDINRITSDKQIGPTRSEGDRNAELTSLDLNTFYQSTDKQYTLMFYILRFGANVEETGGVQVISDDINPESVQLYQYQRAPIKLNGARNQEVRLNVHHYHEYRLGSAFQLYHELDFYQQKNTYKDSKDSDGSFDTFYENHYLSTDSTSEANLFRAFQNEIGIKGDIQKGFYTAFVRRRDILNDFRYIKGDEKRGELYVGGSLRYDINPKNTFGGSFELLQTGDYKFEGKIDNKLFEANVLQTLYQPSLLQTRYFGNHFYWSNNYNSVFHTELGGKLKLNRKGIRLEPALKFIKMGDANLGEYIFFNVDKQPEQTGSVTLFSPGFDLHAKFVTNKEHEEGFVVTNEFWYNKVTAGEDAFRIPEFHSYGKVYWEGFIFGNSMQVQLGAGLFFRSLYYGYKYNPVIQQYFLDDRKDELTQLKTYAVADLFLNFKVGSFRCFFKWNHFNQRNNDGYLITPFYPAQKKILDLGIQWLFFD